MFRFLCILLVILLCGCTYNPQQNTFKEKYNVYADPKIDSQGTAIPGAEIRPIKAFIKCGLYLSLLEDFIDAIVRRMDAKTLAEYHAIQDRLDTLFIQFREDLEIDDKTLSTWPEGYAYRVLFRYYTIRDEEALKIAFATVQYMKYVLVENKQFLLH